MDTKLKNYQTYKGLIMDVLQLCAAEPDTDPNDICKEFVKMGLVDGKKIDHDILTELIEEYL